MRKDYECFGDTLKHFLQHNQHLKILTSSSTSLSKLDDVSYSIVQIDPLKCSDAVKFLKKKAPVEFKDDEFHELLQDFAANNRTEESKDLNNHPLFKMINGHPKALMMVASLLKEKRLLQIYELLTLIEQERMEEERQGLANSELNTNRQNSSIGNIALNLSMEATLIELENFDPKAYTSLIYFALMPAGITETDCFKHFGKGWKDLKQVLMSRKIITEREDIFLPSGELLTLEKSQENSSKVFIIEDVYHKYYLFRLKQSIKKDGKKNSPSQNKKFDIRFYENYVTDFLFKKIKSFYIKEDDNEISLLEENMNAILQRIKHEYLKSKANYIETPRMSEESEVESWIDSDEERSRFQSKELELRTLIVTKIRKDFMRCNSYQKRKQEVLDSIFQMKEEDEYDEESESSSEENAHKTSPPRQDPRRIGTNIMIDSLSRATLQKKKTDKSNQNENIDKVASFMSKIFGGGNDKKNLFQNISVKLIDNRDNVEYQQMFKDARKPIELVDIEIEEKLTTEEIVDEAQTSKNINTLFQRFSLARELGRGKSNIVQYLLENNRVNVEIENYRSVNQEDDKDVEYTSEYGKQSTYQQSLSKLESESMSRGKTETEAGKTNQPEPDPITYK